jgi:hypothetical protein
MGFSPKGGMHSYPCKSLLLRLSCSGSFLPCTSCVPCLGL